MQDTAQLAYKVEPDEDGVAQIVCKTAEEGTLYPEEVSAHVLLRLIDAVHTETGCLVDRAVISVPAYFDESQRESTIAAGMANPRPQLQHNNSCTSLAQSHQHQSLIQ